MSIKEQFKILKRYYEEDEFEKICRHDLGGYFLKMRSLSRSAILAKLAEKCKVDISDIGGKDLFEYLFLKQIDNKILDRFIRNIYGEEREVRKQNEDYLYSQLYKLRIFDWGGFYQNAVEQTIVNNYVKKIQDYDDLVEKVENEIGPRLKGYILCSWYNHWTSILIEDMFKDHPDILPTIGLVKKVDFFWHGFPFDLKVTYFPDGFLELKRKEVGLSSELSALKKFAKGRGIAYDKVQNANGIFYELWTRISEDPSKQAKEFISYFLGMREKIIRNTIANPSELIKWFYEEQGIRRFDAANRLFVVLIDLENLEESWKLKRNKKLLQRSITRFLGKNADIDFGETKICFNWQDQEFTTHAVPLFVIKE